MINPSDFLSFALLPAANRNGDAEADDELIERVRGLHVRVTSLLRKPHLSTTQRGEFEMWLAKANRWLKDVEGTRHLFNQGCALELLRQP